MGLAALALYVLALYVLVLSIKKVMQEVAAAQYILVFMDDLKESRASHGIECE